MVDITDEFLKVISSNQRQGLDSVHYSIRNEEISRATAVMKESVRLLKSDVLAGGER